MKTPFLKFGSLLFILCLVFSSCEDDEDTIPEVKSGEIAIVTAIPNPDGQSGSTFLQLIDDLSPKTYSNENALPFVLNMDNFAMRGDNIFVLPFAQSDILLKYTRGADKKLSKTGELVMDANSQPTSIVIVNETKAYVALMARAKILVINPSTMEKTGEIDIKDYGVGDSNPDANQMVVRDGKLFVALAQMVGGFFPAADRAKVDVLVIDVTSNTVEKMITEESTAMSQPTRPLESNKYMFTDEKNDIYMICEGGFGGLQGHNCGILRIKSGETEFDTSYNMIINTTPIDNESNMANILFAVQYKGNGKLYSLAVVPAYWGNPASFVEDRVCVPVEIDLYEKTIKALNLPRSNPYGSIGLYNNSVVFGLSTDTESGFFTYNPSTGEASANAVINTTGAPSMFMHFGEKY